MKYVTAKSSLLIIAILTFLFVSVLIGYKETERSFEDTCFLLGTVVTIKAFGPEAEQAVKEGFSKLEEMERIFDQYNSTGLVTELNNNFSDQNSLAPPPMKIPQELFAVIKLGQDYGEKTGGKYDISIGPLTKLWTMKENQNELPSQEELDNVKNRIDYQKIDLNSETSTIKLELGMSLDLGGVAKGYIIDQVMTHMKKSTITGAIINAGGNVLTWGENVEREWKVGITDPQTIDETVGFLRFTGGKAVVTSGNYERFYTINEQKYGHILNIESGWSEKSVLGVTVIGEYSGIADILATSAFVLGVEEGLELIRTEGYEGLIIDQSGVLHATEGFENYFTQK